MARLLNSKLVSAGRFDARKLTFGSTTPSIGSSSFHGFMCIPSAIAMSRTGMAGCDEFDETLRSSRTDESDDESCKELSGEAEKAAPCTVRFVSEAALIDLAGIGDWYGDVASVSPPNSCPGESCGMAEVKNSRPPSSMVPAMSESKMRGDSKPGGGSDDGKGSSVEAMAIATRRCLSTSKSFAAFGGSEAASACRRHQRSRE